MSALDQFRQSLVRATPAARLCPALQALWWEGKGDWDRAHQIVQEDGSAEGALVHAYLHRKEGDAGNAAYWYRRAGCEPARDDLAAEWQRIVADLLEQVGDS